MIKKRHKIVPSSYLILIKDNKVLLARRCHTGFEDGNYGLVAGHGEANESATQTLIREVKEESGIDINPIDIKIAHIMHRKSSSSETGNNERIDLFFIAKKYKGKLKIMEPDRCDDLRWFPLSKLPKNIVGYIKIAIENYQKEILYSEHGWNN